jgi:DNA polymerase III delta prime subunit
MSSIITIEINNLLAEYVKTRPITGSLQLDQRIVMVVVGLVGTYIVVITGYMRKMFDRLYKKVFPTDELTMLSDKPNLIHFHISYNSNNTTWGYLNDYVNKLPGKNIPVINYDLDLTSTTPRYDLDVKAKNPDMIANTNTAQLVSSHDIEFGGRKLIIAKWVPYLGAGSYFHLYIYKNEIDSTENVTQCCRDFIKYVINLSKPSVEEKTFQIYEIQNKAWKKYADIPKKSKNTLVGENTKNILEDVSFFENKIKTIYDAFDIPYKRGYMLYGPPGTGKTSAVKCVASQINRNIYKITFNEENAGNDDYKRLMAETPKDSIILFEDIDPALLQEGGFIEKDCNDMFNMAGKGGGGGGEENRKDTGDDEIDNGRLPSHLSMMMYRNGGMPKQKKRVSYGMLLDALDGITSNSGRITFITTNHPNKIGKALLRPGRIDKKFKMDYTTNDEICDYFKMYYDFFSLDDDLVFKNAEKFIKKVRNHPSGCKISFAQLQQHLVRNLADIDSAVEKAVTMFEPEEYEEYV